jgi:hypothetical protein
MRAVTIFAQFPSNHIGSGKRALPNAIENLAKEGSLETRKIKQNTGKQTYYKVT